MFVFNIEYAGKPKPSRRERFFMEIDEVLSSRDLIALM